MSGVLSVSSVVKLVAINFTIMLVVSYENAYDLLEGKQRRRGFEPRRFYAPETFHNSRQRYFTENQNPYLDHAYVNQHFNRFGNGYDNIGNGVPRRNFQHFRKIPPHEWFFHRVPFQERIYSNVGFEDYPVHNFQPVHPKYYSNSRFSNHRSGSPINNAREDEFGSRRNTDYAKTDRFLEDDEKTNQKKKEEMYTRSQEGANVDSLTKEKSGEHLHTDQTGENKTSSRNNKIVRKGHTTRGFSSHHHKDETGNSTTFFDESADYGGQSDVRDVSDMFDTRRTLEQIIRKGDENFFNENGSKQESYASDTLTGNEKFKQHSSSFDGENQSGERHQSKKEEDDLGPRKTYQYLNGDGFDFEESRVNNYY